MEIMRIISLRLIGEVLLRRRISGLRRLIETSAQQRVTIIQPM
jgi:hypothetical protein